jgi:hypothetical protein
MRFGKGGEEFASKVWDANYVGIWYGSWLPLDWMDAWEACKAAGTLKPESVEKELGRQGRYIRADGVNTARRFDDMPVDTWVFTYFDRAIHLAQLADQLELFELLPQFANDGETFKARRIKNKKSFQIDLLPPSFLLLPSAGRGDVHKVPSCQILLDLLIRNPTITEVSAAFDALEWDDWISALGPKGWETLCLGYLIQEHGFLPTGLSLGGTLADFDVVGSLRSGERVYAQCKGGPHTYSISEKENAIFTSIPGARKFFFARCGVSKEIPGVEHVDQKKLVGWLAMTKAGTEYLRLLRPSLTEPPAMLKAFGKHSEIGLT